MIILKVIMIVEVFVVVVATAVAGVVVAEAVTSSMLSLIVVHKNSCYMEHCMYKPQL